MKIVFKNFLTSLKRYRVASILNIFGLIIAFTVLLIVLAHTRTEYGVNQSIADKERVFRLEYFREGDRWEPNFSRPVANLFINSSRHIEAGAVWIPSFNFDTYIKIGEEGRENGFNEAVDLVDTSFCTVFSFDMLEGTTDALREPNKILIPESMARRFFGEQAAWGQRIRFAERESDSEGISQSIFGPHQIDYIVGGVYRDFPDKSVLPNHIYAPLDPTWLQTDWYSGLIYVYVKLDDPRSAPKVCDEFLANYPSGAFDYNIKEVRLNSVQDIYFSEQLLTDVVPRGDRAALRILILVALLIIAISAANYVNFSIALTGSRIRSVNTRKVLGSTNASLRAEIVTESVLITLLSFLGAVLLTACIDSSGTLISMTGGQTLSVLGLPLLLYCALFATGVGILAGIYPAWHMTSFPPALVLNNAYMLTGRVKFVRKTLVGFQYVISFFLIVYALFIHMQNDYIKNTDLGFDKNGLLIVRLSDQLSKDHSERFRQMLRTHPGIADAAFASVPFYSDGPKTYASSRYKDENHYHYQLEVSYNFPELMGIHVTQGRGLQESDQYRQDGSSALIFNQAAARKFDLVVGEEVRDNDVMHYIAGFFPDLHFESMYRPVDPMSFRVMPDGSSGLPWAYIRTTANDLESVKQHIRQTLAEIDPSYPVNIQSFETHLERVYAKSIGQSRLITAFTVIAVLLSVIGIFGLVIFESQNRKKEIIIRKVFGATIGEVLVMLNGGFVKIVLICFVIATPFSLYGVQTWLENFAYHVPVGAGAFLAALISVLILTVFTVTYQSYRVAVTNPAWLMRQR